VDTRIAAIIADNAGPRADEPARLSHAGATGSARVMAAAK
jgi:hypothetical protein